MSDEELHRLLLTRMDSQADDIREIRRQTETIPALSRDVAEAKEHAREAMEQATKTNGKVRSLEKWRAHIEGRLAARGETRASLHAWQIALVSAVVSGGLGGVVWTVIDLIPHH